MRPAPGLGRGPGPHRRGPARPLRAGGRRGRTRGPRVPGLRGATLPSGSRARVKAQRKINARTVGIEIDQQRPASRRQRGGDRGRPCAPDCPQHADQRCARPGATIQPPQRARTDLRAARPRDRRPAQRRAHEPQHLRPPSTPPPDHGRRPPDLPERRRRQGRRTRPRSARPPDAAARHLRPTAQARRPAQPASWTSDPLAAASARRARGPHPPRPRGPTPAPPAPTGPTPDPRDYSSRTPGEHFAQQVAVRQCHADDLWTAVRRSERRRFRDGERGRPPPGGAGAVKRQLGGEEPTVRSLNQTCLSIRPRRAHATSPRPNSPIGRRVRRRRRPVACPIRASDPTVGARRVARARCMLQSPAPLPRSAAGRLPADERMLSPEPPTTATSAQPEHPG